MTFILQVCQNCGTVQYPTREVCRDCLSDALTVQPVDPNGTLLSATEVQVSVEPFFQTRLPWPIGSIKLDCGPTVIAHLADGLRQPQSRATLIRLDGGLVALPADAGPVDPEATLDDLITTSSER